MIGAPDATMARRLANGPPASILAVQACLVPARLDRLSRHDLRRRKDRTMPAMPSGRLANGPAAPFRRRAVVPSRPDRNRPSCPRFRRRNGRPSDFLP